MTCRLGVLGSTRGTVMQAVIDAIDIKLVDAEIVVTLSNKPDAFILTRAKQHHIPAVFVDPAGLSPEVYDEKLSAALTAHDVDLVLLIGYMKILSTPFVTRWHQKVINVHPSLLPKYAGLMDKAVHQAVLDAGDKETGCTIHFVDEYLDGGEIVLQKLCPVEAEDTIETIRDKVQMLESAAFIEAIKKLS